MNRDELLEKLQEIMDRNYQNFRRIDEAELMIREDIADLFRDEIQSRQAAVSGSLPCHHNFIRKDTYWQSCTHCGMLAPLGQ